MANRRRSLATPAARARAGRYKMGTIARLSGFSPAVLRAWESRFDLLDPERVPSGHRLYTDDDLRVLRRIRSLFDAGRSIGEVARLGRAALLGLEPRGGESAATALGVVAAPVTAGSAPAAEAGAALAAIRAELVAAAVAVDAARFSTALDRAFAAVEPRTAIRSVVVPTAYEIGELWAAGRCSVAGEHLASALVSHRLRRLLHDGRARAQGAPRAVCCCFPDETHEVGALVVGYRLAELGYEVVLLGADLPFDDLAHACAANAPRAAFLSVTRPAVYQTHRPRLLRFLAVHEGRLVTVVGGLGVPPEDAEATAAGALLWPGARDLDALEPALGAALARIDAARAARRPRGDREGPS